MWFDAGTKKQSVPSFGNFNKLMYRDMGLAAAQSSEELESKS